ncbi:MAG: glycosyltransferase, partial [Elusimicrobiota bacterium]
MFSIFGIYKLILLALYIKNRKNVPKPSETLAPLPKVTVQLPIFNEYNVVDRLIRATCEMDYPRELIEIQVLDDSNDETKGLARSIVNEYQQKGINIKHITRDNRKDFKAGALAYGLKKAEGEFLAVFDADFVPPKNFLKDTIHYFSNHNVGMVQTRWSFVNEKYSLLTKIQSVFLNGHFILEHTSRNRSGRFFNFNGTAGIWRKTAIQSAGGWHGDTLTEDLDLSYRAQMKGWKFIYLKDLTVPSELPVEIDALKSQQFRWVKGMTQVALKLLPIIWKSDISFIRKLDSTLHLVSNIGYVTTTLMAILVIPILVFQEGLFKTWSFWWAAFFIFTNLLSIMAYYFYAEIELKNLTWRRIWNILCLIPIGVGLSLNGTKAIFDAMRGKKSEFVRTPKYNIDKNHLGNIKKYFTHSSSISVVEMIFASYYIFNTILVIQSGNIYFLPAIMIFAPGY